MEKNKRKDKRLLRIIAVVFMFIALGSWAAFDMKLPGGYRIIPNRVEEKKVEETVDGVRNDSDIGDFKLSESNGVKRIDSSLFKLSAPPSWDLGVVLYQKDGPNVILAISNSTDLGSMAVMVEGVVKGKFQLIGKGKAEEFSKIEEKELMNTKSAFWKDRIMSLTTSDMVKVEVSKVKIDGEEYIKQTVTLNDRSKSNEVLLIKTTYYRFAKDNLIAFDFEYGGGIKKEVLDQIEKVIVDLEI